MEQLERNQMVLICGGSRNCGNAWQTAWVTTTCSVAGGMIGLAFGGIGASVGGLLGNAACSWICHYAC